MSGVFISYRREDTAGYAGRLHDALSARFGDHRVFRDIETIEAGVDFAEVIDGAISSCDVLIAVIGRSWLTCKDATGRNRLRDPDDFVRLEIASALERDVFVVPVLVEGAAMPAAKDLPTTLAKLSRRNALELSDARWHYDVERLVGILERKLGPAAPAAPTAERREGHAAPPPASLPGPPRPPIHDRAAARGAVQRRRIRAVGGGVAAAALVAAGLAVVAGGSGGGQDKTGEPELASAVGPAEGGGDDVRQVTVTNRGGKALTLGRVALAGPGGAAVRIVEDGCSRATVPAGGSCRVLLRLPAPGAAPAAWLALAPVGGGKEMRVDLATAGERVAPVTTAPSVPVQPGAALSPRPAGLDFGTVPVDTQAAVLRVDVANSGAGPVTIRRVGVGGPNRSDFAVREDRCGGGTVQAGAACTIGVSFTPAAAGPRRAQLVVDSGQGRPVVVALVGTGTAGDAAIRLEPGSHDFGEQAVGSTGPVRSFVVANAAKAPVTVERVTVTGAPGEFSVKDGCTGRALDAGASCELGVAFTPTSPRAHRATVTVSGSGGVSAQATVSGAGIGGELEVDPDRVDFGDQAVGTATAPRTVTVVNPGPAPLRIQGVQLTGAHRGDFDVKDDKCSGTTLSRGASCTVAVVFAPKAAGARGATMGIAYGGSTDATAALTGSGTAASTTTARATTPTRPGP